VDAPIIFLLLRNFFMNTVPNCFLFHVGLIFLVVRIIFLSVNILYKLFFTDTLCGPFFHNPDSGGKRPLRTKHTEQSPLGNPASPQQKKKKKPKQKERQGRNVPHDEDLGSLNITANIDRQGAKEIVNKTTKTYNIKIDNQAASYHKLATVFKRDILLQFINQIGCLAALGSRTHETYEKCKNNMEVFEKEMKIAKDNAKKLKTVSADILSAIELFNNDDILQQAIRELQASPSESVLVDAGDGDRSTTDSLAQASMQQQVLNEGNAVGNTKNQEQGDDNGNEENSKEDEEEGSEK